MSTPRRTAIEPRTRRTPGRAWRHAMHRAMRMAVAIGVLQLAACYKQAPGAASSGPMSVLLLVNNQGFYDVNVFALRATAGAGRRLGTVTGNSTVTLRIPESELQPGGTLVVSVRSVGGRSTWVSPPVQLGPGVVGRLDVVQSAGGDLSRSQVYTQMVPRPQEPTTDTLPR